MIRLINMVIILCIFSLVYCLLEVGGNKFYTISFLPISLLLLTIFFHKLYSYFSGSVVFKIFIIQACIRYSILPIAISADMNFGSNYESYYLNIAVLIMVLEVFSIFIIFMLFSKRQRNAYLGRVFNITSLNNNIVLFIFLSPMLYYIYISGSFSQISLVWNLGDYIEKYVTNNEEMIDTGFGIILFNFFKTLLALIFISIVSRTKKIKYINKKWFYLFIILTSAAFIVGTSRFSFVLFALPLMVLVGYLVNNKDRKSIYKLVATVIAGVLLITTIAKLTRYDNVVSSQTVLSAASLNAYFAGPLNIAVGLKAYEKSESYKSILYFINDTFQNVPLLSKITLDEYKVTRKFNEEIYGHSLYADQIVPLSTSGLFHFSIIGVFFYSSVFIITALYIERLSYKTKFIGYKYLLIYLSINTSLVFMLNLGSFYASLTGAFLFLFMPFFLINIFQRIRL